jgi:hypothetical protein
MSTGGSPQRLQGVVSQINATTYQYAFPPISPGYTMVGNLVAAFTAGSMLSPSEQNSYLGASQWTASINGLSLITWSGGGQLANLQLLPTEQLTVQVQTDVFAVLPNTIALQWVGTLMPVPVPGGDSVPFASPSVVANGLIAQPSQTIPQYKDLIIAAGGTFTVNMITEVPVTITGVLLAWFGVCTGAVTGRVAVHDAAHTGDLAAMAFYGNSDQIVGSSAYIPIENYVSDGDIQLLMTSPDVSGWGQIVGSATVYYNSTFGS